MRRLPLLTVLFCLALMLGLSAPAWSGTAKVKECTNFTATTSLTITCTFGSNVSAANLVACASVKQGTTTATTVYTDTSGNTYVNRSYINDTTNLARGIAAYAKNVAGPFTVVTATLSASPATQHYIVCHEVSGADPVSPDDGAKENFQLDLTSTATDAITSTATTTTAHGDYLFAMTTDTSISCPTLTAGTGYTLGGVMGCGQSAHQIQASAGSVAGTFSKANAGATEWLTMMQAFKSSATAPTQLRSWPYQRSPGGRWRSRSAP